MTTKNAKTITVDYDEMRDYMDEHFAAWLPKLDDRYTVLSHAYDLICCVGDWDMDDDVVTIDERTMRSIMRHCARAYKSGVEAARDAMMSAIREM